MATKSKRGFSEAEQAAMRERAKEFKAEERRGNQREKGEAAVLEAISEMPPADRKLAERLHAIVAKAAPELMRRSASRTPPNSTTATCGPSRSPSPSSPRRWKPRSER